MAHSQTTTYGDPKHDRINVVMSLVDLTIGVHILICIAYMLGLGIPDAIAHPYITMSIVGLTVVPPCALSMLGSCTATRIMEQRKYLGNYPSILATALCVTAGFTLFYTLGSDAVIVKLMFLSTVYVVWRTTMLIQR